MPTISQIEQVLEEHFAIFKPGEKEMAGFKFDGPTRLYLEYDDSGRYVEYDVANGNAVETGVIKKPEKAA